MKKKRLVCLVLACLSATLLLCSCGDQIIVVQEQEKPNKVAMSFYVMNISEDAAGDISGISSSSLAASQKMVEEYIAILKSSLVMSRTVDEVRAKRIEISTASLREIFSAKTEPETALIRVEFSSKEYTEEQLLEIARTFCAVAPEEVDKVMLRIGHISIVDAPHIVE